MGCLGSFTPAIGARCLVVRRRSSSLGSRSLLVHLAAWSRGRRQSGPALRDGRRRQTTLGRVARSNVRSIDNFGFRSGTTRPCPWLGSAECCRYEAGSTVQLCGRHDVARHWLPQPAASPTL